MQREGPTVQWQDSGQTTARAIGTLAVFPPSSVLILLAVLVKEMRKLKPRNRGGESHQGHAASCWQRPGEAQAHPLVQTRPPAAADLTPSEGEEPGGLGRRALRVTSVPHPPSQADSQVGPGCAAAMGRQGAQARRGCRRRPSAEALRRSALRERGSHRRTAARVPGARTLSACRGRGRRPACPVLLGFQCSYPAQERCACPCVRSCLCARVSFTDLLLLPGSVRLSASSKILPDFTIFSWKRSKPRLLVICQRPLPASLPPRPRHYPSLRSASWRWSGSGTS